MAMTVNDIVNAVSIDMRSVLSNSGADANLMVGWVDRIHKDCLHTSMYAFLNRGSTNIITVAGTSSYAVSGASPRRVLMVYDRTFNRELLPLQASIAPVSGAEIPEPLNVEREPKGLLNDKTNRPWPEYYRHIGSNLIIFPAPVSNTYIGTIEVHYETQVATLSALANNLVLPEDAKDMVVAGVNYMAASFLKTPEAGQWFQVYEKLKKGDL